MTVPPDLVALARALGVYTHYTDGLERPVTVGVETLVRVCRALGAGLRGPGDAGEALRALEAARARPRFASPVLVAWDGVLEPLSAPDGARIDAALQLEDGATLRLEPGPRGLHLAERLPHGIHRLTLEGAGRTDTSTVIASPVHAWRRPGTKRSWGVSAQLAALRSARSRALGDLRDLEAIGRWVAARGGDMVMVLPLLPTFNVEPPEPSPYSPVSRLFWSELILDLGDAHRAAGPVHSLDVARANAEVRAALAGHALPDAHELDEQLIAYARFRGAQIRLGRNWRDWPAAARDGVIAPDLIDADEERFHLVAQTLARRQLDELRERMDGIGLRIGMDLAVGVHPDGFDPWSRRPLFAEGMSVGAPPDMGFPSGQDWGFPPVLPEASRAEGHRYVAASIAHQAAPAGVLRVDHIMAWTRLYWIPHGMAKHEGTYVSYPAEELFAVLALESDRNRCEIVGENLGTVPAEIDEALPRHRIRGMYLAQFQAEKDPAVAAPAATHMALINTHDTPTFAGWIGGVDIEERIRCGLLTTQDVRAVRATRAEAIRRLRARLDVAEDAGIRPFLMTVLDWLGRSESPLVVPWIEDFWLEDEGVNLPATRSSERPNWQRAMRRLLDDVFADPEIDDLIRRLHDARRSSPAPVPEP